MIFIGLLVFIIVLFLPCLQDSLCLLAQEPFGELLHCLGPVAYLVFRLFSEFGEALVVAVGDKDRVVAEALCALLLARYGAAHDALEERVVGNVAATCESYHGAELRTAVVAVAQACEQLLHVGF